MKEKKATVLFWGITTVFLMLIIGVGGFVTAPGNYIVFAAKIGIWPTLIAFAISLGIFLKARNNK